MEPLLSRHDLAELFGVSLPTVDRLRRQAGFPQPASIGRSPRWQPADIQAWLRMQGAPAPEPRRGRQLTAEELLT